MLFPKVIAFEAVREYIFRTVSQITLNYRGRAADGYRAAAQTDRPAHTALAPGCRVRT